MADHQSIADVLSRAADEVGSSLNCSTAIETFSGRFFDLSRPSPSDVSLEDIAASLSKTCRYAGHCRRYYSVAEHCCHVSDMLPGGARAVGLMHDAAEAYVGDSTRPLKILIPQLRAVEAGILEAVLTRFALANAYKIYSADVKQADNAALKAEANVLMPSKGDDWNFNGVEIVEVRIQCWPFHEAYEQFISRARACGIR